MKQLVDHLSKEVHLSDMTRAPTRLIEEDASACAEILRARLVAGDYREGERLPAERQLCQELSVSRGTLRNALAQLTTQGLLRVRQGSGYTACAWQRQGGPELLGTLADARKSDRTAIATDLLAMRRALALVVLERLIALEFDVRPIRRAVDAFGLGASRGMSTSEATSLDLAVMTELVQASGSIAFQLALNPIIQVLTRLTWLGDAMYAEPLQNSAGYDALVAWLKQPDAAGLPLVRTALEAIDAQTTRALATLSTKKRASRKAGSR